MFPNLAADQPLQFFRAGCWIEEVEAFGWQVPDTGDELKARKGGDGEDVVGEAARVGILFADFLACVGHQQAVQDVRGLVHRGRDGLGGERAELVGDMGIGFQTGFMAVFGVDQIHRFALARGGEELPFTALSAPQIGFAFNVALAGHRRRARTLEILEGNQRQTFALAATSDQANRVADGPLLDVERDGSLGIIRINNSLGDQALIGQFAQALASLNDTTTLLIDLRNTPSGGNTSVARGIMGHFVDHDRPYQMHVIPYETRVLGPTRKFVEFVVPYGIRYPGKVYVAGGRWTGSMGEGLMIGFDAIGATTVGSDLAHLLGALSNETIEGSAAKVDLGTEQLFTVTGLPREAYHPQILIQQAERDNAHDPVLTAIAR